MCAICDILPRLEVSAILEWMDRHIQLCRAFAHNVTSQTSRRNDETQLCETRPAEDASVKLKREGKRCYDLC